MSEGTCPVGPRHTREFNSSLVTHGQTDVRLAPRRACAFYIALTSSGIHTIPVLSVPWKDPELKRALKRIQCLPRGACGEVGVANFTAGTVKTDPQRGTAGPATVWRQRACLGTDAGGEGTPRAGRWTSSSRIWETLGSAFPNACHRGNLPPWRGRLSGSFRCGFGGRGEMPPLPLR